MDGEDMPGTQGPRIALLEGRAVMDKGVKKDNGYEIPRRGRRGSVDIQGGREANPDISFFCPAYYDEKNIRTVVEKAVDVLEKHAGNYEILVVEDGSPDDTARVADELAKEYDKVRVIHHPTNRGYGAALKTGFENADMYPFVCFTDGDNQFDFYDIIKMIPRLEDYDAVISYRLTKAYGVVRKGISLMYNLLVRALFGIPFRDVNSSLKIFRREVIDAIEIESMSPFVDPEILVKAHVLGFRINEVGILSYPRQHGRSSSLKPMNILSAVRDMLRLWRRTRKGMDSLRCGASRTGRERKR